jgi:hypothetical protein
MKQKLILFLFVGKFIFFIVHIQFDGTELGFEIVLEEGERLKVLMTIDFRISGGNQITIKRNTPNKTGRWFI